MEIRYLIGSDYHQSRRYWYVGGLNLSSHYTWPYLILSSYLISIIKIETMLRKFKETFTSNRKLGQKQAKRLLQSIVEIQRRFLPTSRSCSRSLFFLIIFCGPLMLLNIFRVTRDSGFGLLTEYTEIPSMIWEAGNISYPRFYINTQFGDLPRG
jgi:hypothetical protein